MANVVIPPLKKDIDSTLAKYHISLIIFNFQHLQNRFTKSFQHLKNLFEIKKYFKVQLFKTYLIFKKLYLLYIYINIFILSLDLNIHQYHHHK